ncbi:MAG: hypothetical protein WCL16_11760 [bacterium]
MRLFGILAVAATLACACSVRAADDAQNLLRNGGFEDGAGTPAGWQTWDGLTTFWERDPDPARGRYLRFDTRPPQDQASAWWLQVRRGASPTNAPNPGSCGQYATVGGLEGAWFFSDPVACEPGKAYWLTVDARGPGGFVWLLGYKLKPDIRFGSDIAVVWEAERNEKLPGAGRTRDHEPYIHNYEWKGQLKVPPSDTWITVARRSKPFRPTAMTPEVRWLRVMLYACWPNAGTYCYDNVRLTVVKE